MVACEALASTVLIGFEPPAKARSLESRDFRPSRKVPLQSAPSLRLTRLAPARSSLDNHLCCFLYLTFVSFRRSAGALGGAAP